ncbi:MAG: Flp pilus assembly complex ATPase component TadA [Sedimentisphaerales bacterium]|nr:Flp pilus assembly complex ATPase component TadA [Sedimentisphaerales bacterium]
MTDLIVAVEYGGYISIPKFAVFVVLFVLWIALLSWLYRDARAIGTNEAFWAAVVFGAGAAGSVIWLLTPIFVVGLLFYIIVVGASSLGYVMHRNTQVPEFDRILTIEHIKDLFVNQERTIEQLESYKFITANNNDVPLPQPKTPDFLGYKMACDIFSDAIWRRASDVLFTPTAQEYKVTYNVDGTLLKQPAMPRDQTEYFIRFVKNLAALDMDERRKPQKGKFRVRREGKTTDWELATAGSTAGEQIALKQIMQQQISRLSDIGVSSKQREQLETIRHLKQGLFIVSGPRNSGVTTTFYALVRNHDPFVYSISTLERKVVVDLPNITQEVFALSDTGVTTYAKKLLSIVRMGPDIVGVADCADTETAEVACAAAKDGKIVYATVEADNVLKALARWIKFAGDKNLVADTLIGIVNQRLLRVLCDECKQAYSPNPEILRKFNIPPEKAKVFYRAGKVVYDKRGKSRTCENCQGIGFVGRMAIFEIIMINDQLREVIKQSKSLADVGTQFRRAKMVYLQETALQKVIAGTTCINEMVRVLSRKKDQRKRP